MSALDALLVEHHQFCEYLYCTVGDSARAELAQLRADLQAAQKRIKEFESGDLVSALLEANQTQADIIIEQARQLEEARDMIDQSCSDAVAIVNMSDGYVHEMADHLANQLGEWLAANPAPLAKQTATDELLPCPFCGTSDALHIFEDKSEDDPNWTIAYHVECGHCGCHGRNNYPIGWCESEQEAREAWNHRGSIRPMYANPAPQEPQP